MFQIKHYETLETFNNERNNLEPPYIAYVEEIGTVFYYKYRVLCIKQKDIPTMTYEVVDLGLPSGTLWADRNVGATSPEDYGFYFQWGDVTPYTVDGVGEITPAKLVELMNTIIFPKLGIDIEATVDNVGTILEQFGITGTDLINTPTVSIGYSFDKIFNWETYNKIDQIISYDEHGNPNEFKKYSEGKLTVLEPIDDAATVHMGSNYRTPTHTEIYELIDNTTQTFIDLDGNEYSKEQAQNGVIEQFKLKGVRFTGSNGNSIFIPAANRIEIRSTYINGGWGCYHANDLFDSDSYEGFYFNYEGDVYQGLDYRYYPQSVRGVLKQ